MPVSHLSDKASIALFKVGIFFSLEKALSNFDVKFSNIFSAQIAPVGEPSLTDVDPLISKSTANISFCGK